MKERTTLTQVVDLRLGETIILNGEEFSINKLEGEHGEWTIYDTNNRVRAVLNGEDYVTVVGKRGRKHPTVVHFNRFSKPGTVRVQYSDRPEQGSYWCGAVVKIQVFASSKDLVTCEQACGRECDEHWARMTK